MLSVFVNIALVIFLFVRTDKQCNCMQSNVVESMEIVQHEEKINERHKARQFNKELLALLLSKEGTAKQVVNLINEILNKNSEPTVFVQVGAANGDYQTTNDPFQKNIFLSSHWKGVMMEPVPWLFGLLKETVTKKAKFNENGKRLQILNAALLSEEEQLTSEKDAKDFFRVNLEALKQNKNQAGGMWDRLGSFYKTHVVKHLLKHGSVTEDEIDSYIEKITVKTMTAKQVLKHLDVPRTDIDIFVVDTEGYDFEVLKEFLSKFEDFRPWVVIYESWHLGQDDKLKAVEMMNKFGYFTFPEHSLNVVCIKL